MNFLSCYNKKPGVAWVPVMLALLLMLPGFSFGQWQCQDGRACRSCVTTSVEKQEICTEDPGCRASGLNTSDCRACCRYVTGDAPAADRTHKAVFADAPTLPAIAFHFVPVLLPEIMETGFPAASALPPRSPLLGGCSPRAPPSFV